MGQAERQQLPMPAPVFRRLVFLVAFAVSVNGRSAAAQDIEEARSLFYSGQYAECVTYAESSIAGGAYGEAWFNIKAESERMLGRYADANATVATGLVKYTWSIRLRWLGHQAAPFAGQVDQGKIYYDEISRHAQAYPWRYTDADNLVVLGRLALSLGGDAREVQDSFFTRARQNNPNHREPRLALGELALDKHDLALAEEIFREAVEIHSTDPDMHFGLGRALLASNVEEAAGHLQQALDLNPHHIPTWLLRADRAIDAEAYETAEDSLAEVLAVNPHHPEALAYQSALAGIRNDDEAAEQRRGAALALWTENPEVDYVIGRELSQKYRFAEGAEHQRQALDFDPAFLAARKQLAEDLLRLGHEEEGWQLVKSAFADDAYDVPLYNLIQLRDDLEQFVTLEDEHFSLRMEAREAAIYGQSVLALLHDARSTLGTKYGWEPEEPVIVEIFPDSDDFAVRTFGLPGAGGYLGVCFGRVITAQSPATLTMQGTNWQSVLWHEYAHVVTLNITRHRMPRWLSEGISVHEERARNPGCGERMNQQYRELILGGQLTPIGELSEAFLSPDSAVHLQFAYYESSLVVDYIIDTYGIETLHAILKDLGDGVFINDSLELQLGPLEFVEGEFRDYVMAMTITYAPLVDWSTPPLQTTSTIEEWLTWQRSNPLNLSGALTTAEMLITAGRFDEAVDILEQVHEVSEDLRGGSSPAIKLSEVYRAQGDIDREREVLAEYAERDGSALAVFRRLAEIDTEREDWEAVLEDSRRALAVNPLDAATHRAAARSAERLAHWNESAISYAALVELDPTDPAEWHYRLARCYWEQGEVEPARRQVLKSLEIAPRFREAQRLLLSIHRMPAEDDEEPVPPPPPLPMTQGN